MIWIFLYVGAEDFEGGCMGFAGGGEQSALDDGEEGGEAAGAEAAQAIGK